MQLHYATMPLGDEHSNVCAAILPIAKLCPVNKHFM